MNVLLFCRSEQFPMQTLYQNTHACHSFVTLLLCVFPFPVCLSSRIPFYSWSLVYDIPFLVYKNKISCDTRILSESFSFQFKSTHKSMRNANHELVKLPYDFADSAKKYPSCFYNFLCDFAGTCLQNKMPKNVPEQVFFSSFVF